LNLRDIIDNQATETSYDWQQSAALLESGCGHCSFACVTVCLSAGHLTGDTE